MIQGVKFVTQKPAFRNLSVTVGFCISLLFLLGTLCPFCVKAQTSAPIRKIEVTRYNSLEYNTNIAPDVQRAIGNVEFQHEGMTMTCDSAYLYSQNNTLDAFSRVHVTNADGSVTIDGDFAKYQGDTKYAEIWSNVVLVDSNAILKTQHLYYDLNTEIAYYVVGAEIFNKGNDMVSRLGHYHRNINMFYFKKDVVLNTPDYTIVTDTMNYNVQTKVSDFVGPTFIQNESDTIYCERGWYNTNDTVALFRQNAWIKSGSTTVNADTLYYESQTGNGRAFSNITIVDTTNNVILKGHKGKYNNITEKAWMTKEALLIMAGKEDSLFLHADTLRSDVDTMKIKIIRAYNKVKFYSIDMQGMCDSLAVSLQDTIIRMYREPVIWAQNNQMTADYIEIETENQNPKQMNLIGKGFITSEEDSSWFNQIKGRKITGLFRGQNELYRIVVNDDGETIYFTKEDDFLTSANKLTAPVIVIDLLNKRADEITYRGKSEAETIPVIEFTHNELTLMGFKWMAGHQPLDKEDVFYWGEIVRTADDERYGEVAVAETVVETLDSLRRKIELLIEDKQADVGVAIMGFKEKDTLTINNGKHYPTMSVYKYHIALATLRLVDYGRIRMEQKILVKKEDLYPEAYSPLRDDYPNGNMELTVAELMSYMISKSDDNACDIMLNLLNGPRRVEQLVKSMGLSDISIVASEKEMRENPEKMTENWTTPFSAVKALEICFRTDLLSERSRGFLWKLMSETTTGPDKIKGKLPSGAIVGHKTGSSIRNEDGIKLADNDIGIVQPTNGHHFMIAVFIADSKEDDKTNADIIADITRMVWDYYNSKKEETQGFTDVVR